jgi:hypothetical protein
MYLAPKDLLQLSRLSKQLRSMFTHRSALLIWQTVFRNLDLKCFEDLNEIQFASLLYDKCCMVTFCLFCTTTTSIVPMVLFYVPSGMRTYHNGMLDIPRASPEIVSLLSNREVKIVF